jgi:hypothetical protein
MTALLLGDSPTLTFNVDGRIPARSEFEKVWSSLDEISSSWRDLDRARHLAQWCGIAPADCVERLVGVHHVGVYLGDYEHDGEVLAWNCSLEELRDSGGIVSLEVGPSYISPRQYGTQGWWSSIALPDGRAIETFTCLRYGPWQERTPAERRALMSHVALEVGSESDVRHILERLEQTVGALEVIAFTEADQMGHTYGHLRNNVSNSVIEFVHQGQPNERAKDDGHR